MSITTLKYTFSGHESFQCRYLWLKKGYDFIKNGGSFTKEDAVVELGVGKNMVGSIRYWMKAFDLLDSNDKLTQLGIKLLDDEGYDPYLENIASLWLLHFHLVTKGHASIYSLIFNELRREKIEFTKDSFLGFIKRLSEQTGTAINPNTVETDFGVFQKMYLRSESKDLDESFAGILTEIDLLRHKIVYTEIIENNKKKENKQEFYVIENTERTTLPSAIVLYGILQQSGTDISLNFNSLEQDPNQVGTVFALNRTGLLTKIEEIVSENSNVVFSDQAGIRELQFKNDSKPDPFQILDEYYGH
ncbi:DUF4007 family protein [Runella sp. SP2]|uniref:DUF4007 family protein n=1 Tax=Runella sp. SP2 TaxID=2268026 RepID=UPI000F076F4D|nr:DUF4007 family protein [Runella sp. SP2]AYQ35511.1 DUF4007 family protein [Runella sp. SP2]